MRSFVADRAKSAKAVFLDRDGVINRDSADYVKSLAEFSLIPGSVEAIAKLTQAGYEVFVITNQSGLARGIIDMAGLEEIHRYLKNAVREAGGEIRGVYFCPHHPDDGCDCRKPSPGLIRKAAEENGLDISKTVMIGDKGDGCRMRAKGGMQGGVLGQNRHRGASRPGPEAGMEDIARSGRRFVPGCGLADRR